MNPLLKTLLKQALKDKGSLDDGQLELVAELVVDELDELLEAIKTIAGKAARP